MKKALLLAGDLRYDRLTSAGVSTGYLPYGNTVQVQITQETSEKNITSRGRANYGQSLHSITIPSPTKVAIKGNEWDEEMLAMFNLGTSAARSGAGGAVTDEAATAKHDKEVQLLHRDVSNLVVTDSTGTTTYVLNTDYTFDADMGLLKALSTGSITDDESLLVDYDWAAETGYKITPGSETIVRCKLLLHGKNLETGERCVVEIYDARIRSSGGIDYMADEVGEHGFEGTLTIPTGQTEPYHIEYV